MLSVQQLTDTLLYNIEEGFSVNAEGAVPTSGYMVGGYVPSLVLNHPFLDHLRQVDGWLMEHWSYFSVNPTAYYAGVWSDSDTGKIYVDVSRNVDDLYTALSIADAHGELAIWDVANNKEIRTERVPA